MSRMSQWYQDQRRQAITKGRIKVDKMSIKELKEQFSGGYIMPGGYITHPQLRAAAELRKRGYRVSLVHGTIKKKKVK